VIRVVGVVGAIALGINHVVWLVAGLSVGTCRWIAGGHADVTKARSWLSHVAPSDYVPPAIARQKDHVPLLLRSTVDLSGLIRILREGVVIHKPPIAIEWISDAADCAGAVCLD